MDSYIGEIKIWPIPRCPSGWHYCDGTLLPIAGNEALFSVLGIRYGGDARTTFGLPDLRARVPVHAGTGPGTNGTLTPTNRVIGQTGGATTVTLTEAQMPAHTHQVLASTLPATDAIPGSTVVLGTSPAGTAAYMNEAAAGVDFAFAPGSLTNSGGNQAHNNVMPSFALNYIICVSAGTYPVKP